VGYRSLEDLLQSVGNPVKVLRNSETGPYVYPVVPSEFSHRFCLVETMAKTIVEAVATEPRVMWASVRVGKTKALKQARSVNAMIDWTR
jgi:hypothetical protein